MNFANATKVSRKSGEAEGSAVLRTILEMFSKEQRDLLFPCNTTPPFQQQTALFNIAIC
jgi:hypothetical protein